jgi:6-phosphogluconate dehydrogenase
VITAALYARFRSRIENSFGDKLLSAMRKEFGGHIESTIPVHKAPTSDAGDGDK